MFDNEEKVYEGKHDSVIDLHKKVSTTFTIASPGCAWRTIFAGYMSMYGKVI